MRTAPSGTKPSHVASRWKSISEPSRTHQCFPSNSTACHTLTVTTGANPIRSVPTVNCSQPIAYQTLSAIPFRVASQCRFRWNNKNVSALPAEQRPEWFLFPKGHYYSDGCKPEQKNFFFDGGDSNAIVPNTTVGWCIQVGLLCFDFLLLTAVLRGSYSLVTCSARRDSPVERI